MTYDPCGNNPNGPAPLFNNLAAWPQTAETAIDAHSTRFRVLNRHMQPRQNRAEKLVFTQNANVSEENEFATLVAVSNASSWVLFVSPARHCSHLDQFSPVFVVTAIVDQMVAVVPGPGERCGINEEIFADEVDDADPGFSRSLCVAQAATA
jgi:hypothetical protein